MAIICHQLKLLFLMTPRTACTAIGKLLCEEFNGEYIPAQGLCDQQGTLLVRKKHSTLAELRQFGILDAAVIDDYYKVAAVRNPFDSLTSLYIKKREMYRPLLDIPDAWVHRVPGYAEDMRFCQTHSFEDWIAKNFSPSPLKRLFNRGKQSLFKDFTTGVDRVIKFEQVQSDFQALLQDIGVERSFEIPLFNQTQQKKQHYRDYYTPKSRAIIEYVFAQDLLTYSYQF